MPAKSAQDRLVDLLQAVHHPGDFDCAGSQPTYLPQVVVRGVGPLALPLLPMQAAQLIAVAERAPYGIGIQTLVDTQVRRTWQIAAEAVQFRGELWVDSL